MFVVLKRNLFTAEGRYKKGVDGSSTELPDHLADQLPKDAVITDTPPGVRVVQSPMTLSEAAKMLTPNVEREAFEQLEAVTEDTDVKSTPKKGPKK